MNEMNWYRALCLCFCVGTLLSLGAQEESVLRFQMNTPWTTTASTTDAWTIYPRPQLQRSEWQSLNGSWEYAIAPKGGPQPSQFEGRIRVPYPVESQLSGVKRLVGGDHFLWYRRSFERPDLAAQERLLLHFGAVDWEATVYLNGQVVGTHRGGYTAFEFEITDYLTERGPQEIVVRVYDPTDDGTQARGKQVNEPRGIWYTPVTGIWQTVWLERVPQDYVQSVRLTPDIDTEELHLRLSTPPLSQAQQVRVRVLAEKQQVVEQLQPLTLGADLTAFTIPMATPRLWSPDDPFLYDLEISLLDAAGEELDEVSSYTGMRKISLGKDGNGYTCLLLNNQPLFQFGTLDQGWWPDGLYTPPTPEAMVYDIDITHAWGFNMLRKHVKVEPAAFYYECDRRGMLVWQDMPNGNYFQGLRIQAWEEQDAVRPYESKIQFEREYQEMIDQLYNFPSIVTWVPLNEGWGQYDTERLAHWTRAYDPSRLVDAPSGWADRGVGQIIDVHLYPGPGMEAPEENRVSVLGEFGGLGLPLADHLWWDKRNWGYLTFDDQATLQKEFAHLIGGLIGMKSCGLSGAIYTQTTDVEGEVNGLMTYDRKVLKLDTAVTQKLLRPLYQPAHNRQVLLPTSEHQPQYWHYQAGKVRDQWMQPEWMPTDWKIARAPFSAEDNYFLPESTAWDTEKPLYGRTTFYANELPGDLYLEYYCNRAKVSIYLNGERIFENEAKGGRKRHYRHVRLDAATLQAGKNTIAFRVEATNPQAAFDLGLYRAQLIQPQATSKTTP